MDILKLARRGRRNEKNKSSNKVISHLKGDIKTFKKETQEDKELIKELKKQKPIKRK